MDTAQRPSRRQQKSAPRKRAVRQALRIMLVLFLFHTLIQLIAGGSGYFQGIRDFFVNMFWIPENWSGEALSLHRRIVYTVLTTLWSLPFWPALWSFCGFPMLGLMALVAVLSHAPDRLRNLAEGGRFPIHSPKARVFQPGPGPVRRLVMRRRLTQLRKQNLPQVENLCRRTEEARLVQVLSCDGLSKPLHLFQDLSAHPHWAVGKVLEARSPAFYGLIISRDQNNRLGLFQRSAFLCPLGNAPLWLCTGADGELTVHTKSPPPGVGPRVQVYASHDRKE